jgi:predicted DNA-binding protein (UPF0251 family)
MTKDIHKGGRPPIVRPEGFYEMLLTEYETMTTAQMAAVHGVTRSTIQRWLKIARTGVGYGKQ